MDIITTIIPQVSAGICGFEGQTTRCRRILCSFVQGTKHSTKCGKFIWIFIYSQFKTWCLCDCWGRYNFKNNHATLQRDCFKNLETFLHHSCGRNSLYIMSALCILLVDWCFCHIPQPSNLCLADSFLVTCWIIYIFIPATCSYMPLPSGD